MPALDNFEKFLHDHASRTPLLIKAALAHAQFETIHPFLDGNGRVGRLLITFLLCAEGALQDPLLYLSLYFKQHRAAYYESLQKVRIDGDWEQWIEFFLRGVAEVSKSGVATMRQLLELIEADRLKIEGALGTRRASTALRVHEVFKRRVAMSIKVACKFTGLTAPAVASAVDELIKLDIIRQAGEGKRNRQFIYSGYLQILEKGAT